jgi:ABC-type sugar transport system permease subunit/ABC-type glycerol-3-phosphate transport system substrate-binding protein
MIRFSLLLLLFLFLIVTILPGQEQVTLRLVDWASTEEMTIDLRTIEAFHRRYPDIQVLYEPNPQRQYEEKILTGLAAGAPPDVFLLDSKLIPTFTNKKVLLDLRPLMIESGIDSAQWFPEAFAMGRRGDGLFAFPKGFTPLTMFYNRKLFRDAGIPYPDSSWTWDDYLRIARTLTLDRDGDGVTDVYGTAFTNYYFYWIPWVWSAGGDVVGMENHRASGMLDRPETADALSFLVSLRTRYHVAPDAGSWIQAEKTGTNVALFANGKIAMILDGHWRMPRLLASGAMAGPDVGIAPLPRHPSGRKVNVMYESGWCVPVGTGHPREAVLLAAFMAGEEAARIRSRAHLEIPAHLGAAAEMIENDSSGMERIFVEEIRYCRQPWGSIIERFSEIEWILQDAVDEILLKDAPVHRTLSEYAVKVDDALGKIESHRSLEFRPIREHSEILRFLLTVSGILVVIGCIAYLRARRNERRGLRTSFAFLFPSMMHLVVFVVTPIVFAGYLSMHRWDIVVQEKPFVGLENFREIASDASFWNALGNTFVFSLNVPVSMAIALAVALMLRRKMRLLGILRTLYFLPGVTSFVAVALVWMWLYHPSFGAANYLLGLAGIGPGAWLNSSDTAMISIMIFTVWLGMGYQMVIFLAGLQGIPDELYEAARIDGADGWGRFRHVTLPLLKPTTFFILVTSLIGSFQVFTSVYVMTAGGPVGSTDVLVYHIYQAAWEQLRMGYASAISWVLFLLIMMATWVQFRLIGKEVEY